MILSVPKDEGLWSDGGTQCTNSYFISYYTGNSKMPSFLIECAQLFSTNLLSFLFFFFLFILSERGEGRERGREISMCGCPSRAPNWVPGPQPRQCALTGNQTRNPLFCRSVLDPLRYTSQGNKSCYLHKVLS